MRGLIFTLLFCLSLKAFAATPAPKFKGKDLEGKLWSETSKGYLLVDFWASWCLPCLKEIPALNTLYAKYHTLGKLELLGLSLDEGGKAVVQTAVKKHGI